MKQTPQTQTKTKLVKQNSMGESESTPVHAKRVNESETSSDLKRANFMKAQLNSDEKISQSSLVKKSSSGS